MLATIQIKRNNFATKSDESEEEENSQIIFVKKLILNKTGRFKFSPEEKAYDVRARIVEKERGENGQ